MAETQSSERTQASFTLRSRNPDVLTCIANLSSDEVFTPPEFANQMLETVARGWADAKNGANIWTDPTVTFIDPFTKSGVFLREITKRLTVGLAEHIPNLEDRVDHILSKQVFGIGITEITALLARRSLYCSKFANGKHSIARSFDDADGNIWYEETQHAWVGGTDWVYTADATGKPVKKFTNGRCKYCGTSQKILDRGEGLESHAYAFIHTSDARMLIAKAFGESVQFDVVIGNPPYQLGDGGGEGSSAIPIYQHFVNQAKALGPQQLVMVIPARWYSGGKGLDSFRETMLTDEGLAEIHDYAETSLAFPGVNIRGGVCFFRWTSTKQDSVLVTNYSKTAVPSSLKRPALEPGLATFVRHNAAVSILRKIHGRGEDTFSSRVHSRNPFGIPSNFTGFQSQPDKEHALLLFRSRRGSSHDKQVYVSTDAVQANHELVGRVKVIVSKASPGGDEYPHAIFSQPIVAPRGSVCTETYLLVDLVESEEEGRFLVAYMRTRFFRFLVSLIKTTQNISKSCFSFVPVLELDREWTDKALYERYNITLDEQAFVESMIRPMELG